MLVKYAMYTFPLKKIKSIRTIPKGTIWFWLFCLVVFMNSCGSDKNKKVDQKLGKVPDFKFINQDSTWVTLKDFENSIYVTDFFFIQCKGICPIMKTNMLNLYHDFKDEDRVKFLSHTIDPERDNVLTLKEYANTLQVEAPKWHFVTGEKDKIYSIAHDIYKNSVLEDAEAEDGFIHSGAFILVNQNQEIVRYYDGTQHEEIKRLKEDLRRMLDGI